MAPKSTLARHAPFLALIAFLFLAALYVEIYLDAFTYVLINSRLLFQLFVGVTVIAVLKNVVGIQTFGTFAPAIIALAFLQAGLIIGTALLLNILAIVIATREMIRRELVQQDHRVAIQLIMVGLTIVVLEVLAEYFHLPQLDFTFLFPVLILAWTSERFVEGVDRTGWERPSKELFWTLVTIVVAYLVMVQVWLVDFVILMPLTWPLLVLINWYLGTQVRVRLLERRRFRETTGGPNGVPSADVLTMNVRNREFVSKYNDPALFPLLTKARTKETLSTHGVPVPETLLVVHTKPDLGRLEAFLRDASQFVVKPASGFGGEGIVVVRGREGGTFRTNQGPMTPEEIVAHAQYIQTGAFANATSDEVLVEALVVQHPAMKDLVPEGLADVRVIAFQGFPVMAMARLPTHESGGRANLHSGAVGCGIQISLGRVTRATWHGRAVAKHPDTGAVLGGFAIPFWSQILEIAAQAQVASGLGYAGVDIVLDAKRGPLALEVNKRPGLEIQNANRAGLLKRLRAIERLRAKGDVEDRTRRALDLDVSNWEAAA
jgi:alpha-L-glutamate ligase-like protein